MIVQIRDVSKAVEEKDEISMKSTGEACKGPHHTLNLRGEFALNNDRDDNTKQTRFEVN